MTTEPEPLKVESYGGVIVVFSRVTGQGVRVELKRRLCVISPDEARTVGRWLIKAADEIEGPDRKEAS